MKNRKKKENTERDIYGDEWRSFSGNIYASKNLRWWIERRRKWFH